MYFLTSSGVKQRQGFREILRNPGNCAHGLAVNVVDPEEEGDLLGGVLPRKLQKLGKQETPLKMYTEILSELNIIKEKDKCEARPLIL